MSLQPPAASSRAGTRPQTISSLRSTWRGGGGNSPRLARMVRPSPLKAVARNRVGQLWGASPETGSSPIAFNHASWPDRRSFAETAGGVLCASAFDSSRPYPRCGRCAGRPAIPDLASLVRLRRDATGPLQGRPRSMRPVRGSPAGWQPDLKRRSRCSDGTPCEANRVSGLLGFPFAAGGSCWDRPSAPSRPGCSVCGLPASFLLGGSLGGSNIHSQSRQPCGSCSMGKTRAFHRVRWLSGRSGSQMLLVLAPTAVSHARTGCPQKVAPSAAESLKVSRMP